METHVNEFIGRCLALCPKNLGLFPAAHHADHPNAQEPGSFGPGLL